MDTRKDSRTETRKVNLSMADVTTDVSSLFTPDGIRVMLEGKCFDQLGYLFLLVAAFVDRAMDDQHHRLMRPADTNISELWRPLHC